MQSGKLESATYCKKLESGGAKGPNRIGNQSQSQKSKPARKHMEGQKQELLLGDYRLGLTFKGWSTWSLLLVASVA